MTNLNELTNHKINTLLEQLKEKQNKLDNWREQEKVADHLAEEYEKKAEELRDISANLYSEITDLEDEISALENQIEDERIERLENEPVEKITTITQATQKVSEEITQPAKDLIEKTRFKIFGRRG